MSAETKRYPAEVLGPDEDDGRMPENVEQLRQAVVGRKIVAVEHQAEVEYPLYSWMVKQHGLKLTLDDGTSVTLVDTDDCCAFTQLHSVVEHLDKIDHVITGVGTTGGFTTWHIYADLGDVLELEVGWSAGNPFYYGYGFDIVVDDGTRARRLSGVEEGAR